MSEYKLPLWIKNIREPKLKKNKNYISIYSPLLNGNESKYVNECLKSTWISSKGNFVKKFERAFANFLNIPYAISTSSGTAALFLALKCLKLKKTDEVIIPTFTMVSTALAVNYNRAKIIFADCNLDDGNISINSIAKLITKNTKAIIPVHIYGNPCDLDNINNLSVEKSIRIIEDAAEAIGSEFKNRKVGESSYIACFSTYVNKIVTTGEGGMIVLRNKKIFSYLNKLNNYFFSKQRHFWHKGIGYNLRLSNLEAAVGLAQIECVEKTLNKKRIIFNNYKKMLKPVYEYFIPLKENIKGRSNYWQVAFRLRYPSYNLIKLRALLAENSIETRTFFIPLHLQPVFYKNSYNGKFPNSELLAKTGILLPSGPGMNINQVEKICSLIINYFKN